MSFALDILASRFAAELPGESAGPPGSRPVHGAFWSATTPTYVPAPRLLASPASLRAMFGLSDEELKSPQFASVFSGQAVSSGTQPVSTNYGGHQFGHWAGQLGDGRAILLGELAALDGTRWEAQLKGAGPTPYSRRADGRAVLRSSLREYVASEAMQALGVPTTRALSLITTGESVVRDMLYDGHPKAEPGAVVCRLAPSFLRFGHFELPASRGEHELVEALLDHTIATHFPQCVGPDARADWFAEVARRTGVLMAHWMRVGFVHGVMNTDNMSVLGLTIDYGPFGFLEEVDPHWTPNTTDLPGRRYRYAAQPQVAHWNLSALASALAPRFADAAPLQTALDAYVEAFQQAQARMWADKLGFAEWRDEDAGLVQGLMVVLPSIGADFTLFFRRLAEWAAGIDAERSSESDHAAATLPEAAITAFSSVLYRSEPPEAAARDFHEWLQRYAARLGDDSEPQVAKKVRMDAANPLYVPRNWLLQQAIDAAESGDPAELHALMAVLQQPYTAQAGAERFAARRPDWALNRPGCSALSCSS